MTRATYPSLLGRTALVTGAGGGIGRAICTAFAEQGVRVFATDRIAPDAADGIEPLTLDVTEKNDWARVMGHIERHTGEIDILVNNAGIYGPASLEAETAEGFEKIMAVNQFGTFWGMKSALPLLSEGGSVINLSSIGGMVGYNGTFGYAGAKWSVRGMTRSAARELAPRKIRVNTVCPGVIETPMFYENDPAQLNTFLDTVPMGALGAAADIANAVVFLASDQAAYITGSDILVDGGILA